ncbi:hypothetical protein HPB49_020469 [Dermacentor silvarum]|uniref:Uncharacterized protein n=1 Tax=Dermacentor silvarum TaxID=543639 RepID=A0ACB8DKI5_DERSI|nr:hypothetical protein HPB49_020469 [Dermacentor silvarum]
MAAAVILGGVSTTAAATKIKTTLDPDYAQTQPREPTFSACLSHWGSPPVWTSILALRGASRFLLVTLRVNKHLENQGQLPQQAQWMFQVACCLVQYCDTFVSVVLGLLPLVSPYDYATPHGMMAAVVILGGAVTTTAAATIKTKLDSNYTKTQPREPTFSACLSHWGSPPVWTTILGLRGASRFHLVTLMVSKHLENQGQVPQQAQWMFQVACCLVQYCDTFVSVVLGLLPLVSPYDYATPHGMMAAVVILGGAVTTTAAATIKTKLDSNYTKTSTVMIIAVMVCNVCCGVMAVILGAVKDNLRPDWSLWCYFRQHGGPHGLRRGAACNVASEMRVCLRFDAGCRLRFGAM